MTTITNLRVSNYVTFPKDSNKILQQLQLIDIKINIYDRLFFYKNLVTYVPL